MFGDVLLVRGVAKKNIQQDSKLLVVHVSIFAALHRWSFRHSQVKDTSV